MKLARYVLARLHNVYDDFVWRRLLTKFGILRSTSGLSRRAKKMVEVRYAVEERANVALAVASMYPGGDYFEFGSAGFRTLRNFLTAFDLNDLPQKLPETRFFAFDVFGDIDAGRGVPAGEAWYFEHYRGNAAYGVDRRDLMRHDLLLDRCEVVKGYFADTLNEVLKERLRREGRRIGFAFLDCNIGSSYRTCFDFIIEFIRQDRVFVYMDEYFITLEVPAMFGAFARKAEERYGLKPHYVRSAGGFGALFCLMSERQASPAWES